MAQSPQPDAATEPLIKIEQAAGFLRRLTHDIRNALNALDLQLLLVEGDEEAIKEQIAEARQTISSEARRLGDLSNQFQVYTPQWIVYPAPGIVEDLRLRLAKRFGPAMARVAWPEVTHDANLRIDFDMLAAVLGEVISNALRFADGAGRVTLSSTHADGELVFSVTHSRKTVAGNIEQWGMTPFTAEPRAGYGLGLFAARRMADAMGMKIEYSHDAANGVLTTRLRIPIVEG